MGKTRKFDSLIIIIIMVMVNGEHKNILSIMAFAMDHCIKIHSNNNGRKTQLSNFNKIFSEIPNPIILKSDFFCESNLLNGFVNQIFLIFCSFCTESKIQKMERLWKL